MPKICYVQKKFHGKTLAIIEKANEIISVYRSQGYDLTLRQLYYQFVSRDIIPNNQKEYNKLGQAISDARRAGLVDWDSIVDRTRNLKGLAHWDNPSDIISSAAYGYHIDKWDDQPYRVEVWIEKDALAGVFERVCNTHDISFFSCRGYNSDSEMWASAQRLNRYRRRGQQPVILHFGDHDPSGLDMTRDIEDRHALFGCRVDVRRLALTMEQIEEYDPPPNPAKVTDARYANYEAEYGDESWELDALEPSVLAGLVESEIKTLLDAKRWKAAVAREKHDKDVLLRISNNWNEVELYAEDNFDAVEIEEEDDELDEEDDE